MNLDARRVEPVRRKRERVAFNAQMLRDDQRDGYVGRGAKGSETRSRHKLPVSPPLLARVHDKVPLVLHGGEP